MALTMTMLRPFLLWALTCACASAAGIGSIVSKVGTEIKKDIADISQPFQEGVFTAASSQCEAVKKLLGLTYEQLDDQAESNVQDLTLVFQSSELDLSFNITTAAQEIPRSGYDTSQKLYIFIHGFTDSPDKEQFPAIRDALFAKGKCNVLALDASKLIKSMYLQSSTYVAFIGEKLGEVLAEMVKGGLNPADIHIIGHSLGGHISGFTGKQFTRLTGKKVGRISGLDPAGPCFSHVDDDKRIQASDADFVDVTHTNAGVEGLDNSVGHVDYWPNGGSQQTNCLDYNCSHQRPWMYFAESVTNPKAFPAVKCNSWAQFKEGKCSDEISYMGWASDPSASGNYYLRTGNEPPFGLGVNGTWYDKSEEGIVRRIAGIFS